MMKGSMVSVATVALGSTWRRMILVLDSPSARAARTYSKLRARKNSARTTWTSWVQSNSSRMNSSDTTEGAMNEDTMISTYRLGSDDHTR